MLRIIEKKNSAPWNSTSLFHQWSEISWLSSTVMRAGARQHLSITISSMGVTVVWRFLWQCWTHHLCQYTSLHGVSLQCPISAPMMESFFSYPTQQLACSWAASFSSTSLLYVLLNTAPLPALTQSPFDCEYSIDATTILSRGITKIPTHFRMVVDCPWRNQLAE